MKKWLVHLENALLFSPFFLVLVSIFNFSDTKSLISRLSLVVILYCLVRHREAIKTNWDNKEYQSFFYVSSLIFFYFTVMHLWRGDNFGFPRTLLTCLVYIAVIPWRQFSQRWIINTVVIAAYICGFNALYEHLVMNVGRVGIATNPIPYALYCAFLSLSSLYLVNFYSRCWQKATSIAGCLLALYALVLTDVRGVLIVYPVMLSFVLINLFPRLSKVRLMGVIIVVVGGVYLAFKPTLDTRFERTAAEFQIIAQGNYGNSIGVRLDLWQYGIQAWQSAPLFGLGDDSLEVGIRALPNKRAARQPHLHNQYIDTLARYGLIGAILWFSWLASAVYTTLNRDSSSPKRSHAPAVLMQTLIGLMLLASLTDIPFHHTHMVYLFSLIVGSLIMTRPHQADNANH
ncbi:O-antigen ligase family protein [Vibrio sp. NH-UV-68]|uniref:O-antigen ligase family protein n=1 Tax=unclassified Vibrio TaxID=2614977 RepID=UPI0036F2247D